MSPAEAAAKAEDEHETRIVIYSNDSETVWNAFRLGNLVLKERPGQSIPYWQKASSANLLIPTNST
jgi:hypothetical protein